MGRLRYLALVGLAIAALVSGSGCALVSEAKPGAAASAPTSIGQSTPRQTGTAPVTDGLPNVAEVAALVRPAVVSVATQEISLDTFLRPVQEEGVGSGIIFDKQGHILTNNHVVANARKIQVSLPDGRTFDNVKVVGRDPRTDLAVLKIDGSNLPSVVMGDSDKLVVGEWVIAIGNALGLEGGPTVTAGVVGALGRSITEPSGDTLDDLIQTDAAINPGNSGGPLINLRGEIIGINTAIDTRGQGIGFAISINSARPIFTQLLQQGRIVRPYLGVNVATLTPNIASQLGVRMIEGVVVANVQANGPAGKAGLKAADIITQMDGARIKSVKELVAAVQTKKPGDQLKVTYSRKGTEQTVTVTLQELPSSR